MGKVKKVPMVMQMEMVECGAASLGMVLAYHKKWLPLEQLRKDCGVSRDGCSAKQLLQAGRSYGMKASAYRLEPNDLDGLPLSIGILTISWFIVVIGVIPFISMIQHVASVRYLGKTSASRSRGLPWPLSRRLIFTRVDNVLRY